MSEIRQDPIFGGFTILADERARRPQPPLPYPPLPEVPEDLCPFCPGHEGDTPPPIRKVAGPGGWRQRVVPNRYPALRVEGAEGARSDGPYESRDGLGAHEVVIESATHRAGFPEQGATGVAEVVEIWRERVSDLERDRRLRHVLVFRNEGLMAGATLSHPHSQILATPIVPPRVESWVQRSVEYHARAARCRLCVLLEHELGHHQRVLWVGKRLVALCPYAPRVPFEVWIAPRDHETFFDEIDEECRGELGSALAEVARLHRAVLAGAGWNLVVHHPPNRHHPAVNGPTRRQWASACHWFIEVLPRVVPLAGFEWGAGGTICSMPPERAANRLRTLLSPTPRGP